jgi:hypothetical protein
MLFKLSIDQFTEYFGKTFRYDETPAIDCWWLKKPPKINNNARNNCYYCGWFDRVFFLLF